jgi:hypothetical protein
MAARPTRWNALMPPDMDLELERSPALRLAVEFRVLVLTVGDKEARRLWKNAAKRPHHRPLGSSRPEQDKELLALVDAINKPEPIPVAQAAKLIHDALPEYGPSAKSIEMRIKRLKAAAGPLS